jgi:ABC-type transporter Mla subunit MlaD
MDETAQEGKGVTLPWGQWYKMTHDQLLQKRTRLNTLIEMDTTKGQPYESIRGLASFIKEIFDWLGVLTDAMNVLHEDVSALSDRVSTLDGNIGDLQQNIAKSTEVTGATLQKINDFVETYTPMLEHLADEGGFKRSVGGHPKQV